MAEWCRDENGNSVYGTRVRCRQCGKTFTAGYALARYCSYRCRNDAYIARRKEWRAEARNLTCENCGKPFIAKRNDAKFCTAACRQANHRQRNE